MPCGCDFGSQLHQPGLKSDAGSTPFCYPYAALACHYAAGTHWVARFFLFKDLAFPKPFSLSGFSACESFDFGPFPLSCEKCKALKR